MAIVDVDISLVINAPDGIRAQCRQLDPRVTFSVPDRGHYDVWVGTYATVEVHDAALFIIELPRD